MHIEALVEMTAALEHLPDGGLTVLDVGSLDYNGTYRPLIEGRGWTYTGLDIEPGPNVDIVTPAAFRFPLSDGMFDVVISGSTMEHVTAIWRWLPELVRVLKPGGWLVIITHWQFKEHRHPLDCWRILPDGMQYLFDETGELAQYDIRLLNDTDILGKARKATAI